MLTIDYIETMQPPHTSEVHFLVKVDSRHVIGDHMQVNSTSRNCGGISDYFTNK